MNGPEEKHNFVSRGTLHKGLCYIANEEKLLRVQIHGSKSQRAVDIRRQHWTLDPVMSGKHFHAI